MGSFLFLRQPKLAKTQNGTLSRIVSLIQHVVKVKGFSGHATGIQSFGMMSADRNGMTPAQLKPRREWLKQAIRAEGLGYITQVGVWHETVPGIEAKIPVRELSFLVPNIPMDKLCEFARHLDQECVIYGGPDNDNKAALVGSDGHVQFDFGDLTVLSNSSPEEIEKYENRSEIPDKSKKKSQPAPYAFK